LPIENYPRPWGEGQGEGIKLLFHFFKPGRRGRRPLQNALALGERVRVREKFDASFFSSRDAEDAVPSSRFSLALWERVRVRE